MRSMRTKRNDGVLLHWLSGPDGCAIPPRIETLDNQLSTRIDAVDTKLSAKLDALTVAVSRLEGAVYHGLPEPRRAVSEQ